VNSCVNSPEDGPVGPKHVEIRQYINKIEIVTSLGFYSICWKDARYKRLKKLSPRWLSTPDVLIVVLGQKDCCIIFHPCFVKRGQLTKYQCYRRSKEVALFYTWQTLWEVWYFPLILAILEYGVFICLHIMWRSINWMIHYQ